MSRSTDGRRRGEKAPASAQDGERIQKALASAGVASRRAIEDLIREERIKVNGELATLGHRVSVRDRITVDGRGVKLSRTAEPPRVLLYKKRVGELVTRSDPDGRRTIFRKLPELENGRWIAIGRLDINTSGLLLLTNDGELARRMTHPSFEIKREYAVRVLGEVNADLVKRLKCGVELDDGPAHFDTIEIADGREHEEEGGGSANRWFHVSLHEGRNRLVRRLFESQDLQVSRLIRIAYGPIALGGGIKSGSYRELDRDELKTLLQAVDMQRAGKPAAKRRRASDDEDRDDQPTPKRGGRQPAGKERNRRPSAKRDDGPAAAKHRSRRDS